jgi:hypothetical protein
MARLVERAVACAVAMIVLVAPCLFSVSDQGTLAPSSQQGYDFAAYYRAGHAVLVGSSPYVPETVAGPFSLTLRFGYFYPPPFAAGMIPLALFDPFVANALWIVLIAAGLVLAGATIAGAGDPRRAETPTAFVIALALGLSTPGFSGMAAGNVSPLLGVLSLAPLLATRQDALAGIAPAVGALTKIEPGLWGAYLLGAGRMRAVLAAAATGIGIIAATWLLPGVRAGWAEYPRVLANAAVSERAVEGYLGGNLSIAGLLGLSTEMAHVVEVALLGGAVVLMLLAGRYGKRFAPLAASVAMFSTPSMWLHSCLLAVPAALAVVALGPGARVGRLDLSGVRLAEALAVAFLVVSYLLLFVGVERLAAFILVIPLVLAAAVLGPRTQATDSGAASFSTSKV